MKLSSRTFVAVVGLLLATWIVCLVVTTRAVRSIPAPVDTPLPAWDRLAWDRLYIGMSRAEVADRLGPPSLKAPPIRFGSELAGRSWTIFEVFAWIVAPLWIGGIDGFCWIHCERWEYDEDPGVTPRPFFQIGPSPDAFVVYFTDERVVWLRRPTADTFRRR
jgi:hypothetical protein